MSLPNFCYYVSISMYFTLFVVTIRIRYLELEKSVNMSISQPVYVCSLELGRKIRIPPYLQTK